MPMVIREGKPCGLKRMSGVTPPSVKGMSSCGQRKLMTWGTPRILLEGCC